MVYSWYNGSGRGYPYLIYPRQLSRISGYNKSLDPVSWILTERAGVSNSIKTTYVTNHGYVAGLSDYGFNVARAFRSKEGCNLLADHIDHCLRGFHRFSPRVAPSHHQLHVWQYIRIAVDLERIYILRLRFFKFL